MKGSIIKRGNTCSYLVDGMDHAAAEKVASLIH
jgi:hypothetical protein